MLDRIHSHTSHQELSQKLEGLSDQGSDIAFRELLGITHGILLSNGKSDRG